MAFKAVDAKEEPEKKEPKSTGSDKIVFFGEVDLDRDGKITSDMPAWYFRGQVQDLEENINRKKKGLERGYYAADQIPRVKNEIEAEEKKLTAIKESEPKLSGDNLDRVAKEYASLQKQIRETMPTRKETKDGLVNPYDELKRLKTRHIEVSPDIAAACGCKPVDGKITGDQAAKCYQIMGRALGENTSVEKIRRDGNVPAYKTIDDLADAILRGREVKT